jgi:hypothetical protein
MSQSVNVADLFQTAGQDGLLSPGSVHALTTDPNLGGKIQRALGGPMTAVGSDEVILVGMMPDDSGSISGAGNTQAIRDGYNLTKKAFMDSKQKDNVYIHGRLLNGSIVNPFMLLDTAPDLDNKNYDESYFSGTPLYDASFEFIGSIVAESQRYRNELNITARGICLIISDGMDEHSRKHRNPAALKQLILDLNASEDFVVAGMGVQNSSINFYDIFGKAMGIEDKWILTPKSDPHEIRQAFQLFSLTAVRMSQSGALFSATKAGGFGAPGSQAAFGGFGTNP